MKNRLPYRSSQLTSRGGALVTFRIFLASPFRLGGGVRLGLEVALRVAAARFLLLRGIGRPALRTVAPRSLPGRRGLRRLRGAAGAARRCGETGVARRVAGRRGVGVGHVPRGRVLGRVAGVVHVEIAHRRRVVVTASTGRWLPLFGITRWERSLQVCPRRPRPTPRRRRRGGCVGHRRARARREVVPGHSATARPRIAADARRDARRRWATPPAGLEW